MSKMVHTYYTGGNIWNAVYILPTGHRFFTDNFNEPCLTLLSPPRETDYPYSVATYEECDVISEFSIEDINNDDVLKAIFKELVMAIIDQCGQY